MMFSPEDGVYNITKHVGEIYKMCI